MIQTRPILAVDDDPAIRDLVQMALEGEGYEVLLAEDGAEALEVLAEAPPGLILLDMRMPRMDGWQFAQAYRDLPGPHAPLVVMTASLDAGKSASEIGANGYVGKPFDIGELLGVVEGLLPD